MEEDKKEISKEYTNGEVTIVWKPDKCFHATFCWREAPELFNPRKRPWVNLSDVPAEKIIKQIERCPSGALTCYYNDKKDGCANTSDNPSFEKTQIELIPNGPLMIAGNLSIKNVHGDIEVKCGMTAFCRCGGTKNKPYCDGTHAKNNFKG